MKNYPNFDPDEQFHAVRNEIVELDNQIWSLVDYIRNFNPNYQILNYTENSGPAYYTQEELRQLKVIEQKANENSLVANINHLPKHFGIYNNFSTVAKEKRFWSDDGITRHWWPEGTVIIANNVKTLPIEDAPENRRYNKDKYFIARLSAAATFYEFERDGLNKRLLWSYKDKAEEEYGTSIITTFSSVQPRFFFNDSEGWATYNVDQTYSFESYRYNNGVYTGKIISQIGSFWTTSYLLNHELIWQKNAEPYGEDFICDDIRSIEIANVDSLKIPTYNISIKDWDLETEQVKINLW